MIYDKITQALVFSQNSNDSFCDSNNLFVEQSWNHKRKHKRENAQNNSAEKVYWTENKNENQVKDGA